VSAVVFSEWLNGAAVTAAPEFVPSTLNCTLVVFDDTVVVTVTVPETVAPDAGELIDIVGAVALFTVIGTAALVVCPEASLATAVSEWLPLVSVVVFSEWLNGAVVTAAPEFVPSTLNCTLVVFDDTVAVTVTVPDTVAPDAGELMDMVGAAPLFTVIGTAALAVCPEASLATAVSE
jgi:hypothetical protein